MTKTPAVLLLLTFVVAEGLSAFAQERRFTEGELIGFTKSNYEHIINRLDQPIVVKNAEGQASSAVDGTELEDTLIEVRLPETGRVVGTRTNKNGHFKLKLKPGTYLFKATKDGFQSVIGTLVVSKDASRRARILIEMKMGV